jgi:hypothetical protein
VLYCRGDAGLSPEAFYIPRVTRQFRVKDLDGDRFIAVCETRAIDRTLTARRDQAGDHVPAYPLPVQLPSLTPCADLNVSAYA